MILEAIQEIKIRLPDGSVDILPPGERFEPKDPAVAERLIREGRARPVEVTEGRRRSLENHMDALICTARDEVQAGGRWKMSPSVEEIEIAIHAAYEDVLQGLRKLSQYREIVTRWKDAGTVH